MTSVVGTFNLAATARVSVEGPLPQNLLSSHIPQVPPGDLAAFMVDGVSIALVSIANTGVLSKSSKRAHDRCALLEQKVQGAT